MISLLANRAFVESFCRKVLTEGLQRLPWYCISRLDTVDADTLRSCDPPDASPCATESIPAPRGHLPLSGNG